MLAAEPRLLIPRDVNNGKLAFAHVRVDLADTAWYSGYSMKLKAPCLLPELHMLKRVSIHDERYHNVAFEDLERLREILYQGQGVLNVKQKAGCLSYKEDKEGFRSLTAQCLTSDTSFQWCLTASSRLLASFSSEPGVSCFSRSFVQQNLNTNDAANNVDVHGTEEVMGSLLYECASHEKLDLLPFWISTFQVSIGILE